MLQKGEARDVEENTYLNFLVGQGRVDGVEGLEFVLNLFHVLRVQLATEQERKSRGSGSGGEAGRQAGREEGKEEEGDRQAGRQGEGGGEARIEWAQHSTAEHIHFEDASAIDANAQAFANDQSRVHQILENSVVHSGQSARARANLSRV